MHRELFGFISVDFDARDQLLLSYSALFKYLTKGGVGDTTKQ